MIIHSARSSLSRSPKPTHPVAYRRATPGSERPSALSNVFSTPNLRSRRRNPTVTSLSEVISPTIHDQSTVGASLFPLCKRQLRHTDTFLGLTALFSVFLSLTDSDLYFSNGMDETGWLQWLRLLECGLIALLGEG